MCFIFAYKDLNMEEQLEELYSAYKSAGLYGTFEEFKQAKEELGDDKFYEFINNIAGEDPLKKKADTVESLNNIIDTPLQNSNSTPVLTSLPISQEMEPIQNQEYLKADSSESEYTPNMLSSESELASAEYSGTENYKQTSANTNQEKNSFSEYKSQINTLKDELNRIENTDDYKKLREANILNNKLVSEYNTISSESKFKNLTELRNGIISQLNAFPTIANEAGQNVLNISEAEYNNSYLPLKNRLSEIENNPFFVETTNRINDITRKIEDNKKLISSNDYSSLIDRRNAIINQYNNIITSSDYKKSLDDHLHDKKDKASQSQGQHRTPVIGSENPKHEMVYDMDKVDDSVLTESKEELDATKLFLEKNARKDTKEFIPIKKFTKETIIGDDTLYLDGSNIKSVEEYNKDVVRLQNHGLVEMIDNGKQYETTPDGRFLYKIVNDDYLSNVNAEIDKINGERKKLNTENNININRRNLGIALRKEEISPLESFNRLYHKETGELIDNADFNKIANEQGRNDFLAEGIARKRIKDNPKLNFDLEKQKAYKEIAPYSDDELYKMGYDFFRNKLLSYISSSEEDGDVSKEKTWALNASLDRKYMTDFAKWWFVNKNKDIYTASEFREKDMLGSQFGRDEILSAFEEERKNTFLLDTEINLDIYNQARAEAKFAKEKRDHKAFDAQMKRMQIAKVTNSLNREILDKTSEIEDQRKISQEAIRAYNQKLAQQEADYANNEILGVGKGIAGNIWNQVIDATTGIIAGVPRFFNNITWKSDTVNYALDKFTKPAEVLGVRTSGMFNHTYTYDNGKKEIIRKNGFYFEKGLDGNLIPITISKKEERNLSLKNKDYELSVQGLLGTIAGQAVMMVGAEFAGAKILGTSSRMIAGAMSNASKVYGAESSIVRGLYNAHKLAINPTNNGVIGWTIATLDSNYKDALNKELKGYEIPLSMIIQSAIVGVASKINPDVKFFKESKNIEEALINALRNSDKHKYTKLVNEFTDHFAKNLIKQVPEEITQEYVERLGQSLGEVFTSTVIQKDTFTPITAEEISQIAIETAGTVVGLNALNKAIGRSRSYEKDGTQWDISSLSRAEQLSLLANIYTPNTFADFRRDWGIDNKDIRAVEDRVKTLQKYLQQIPNREEYSLDGMFKIGVELQKIEYLKSQMANSNSSFHEEINARITESQDKIQQIIDKEKDAEVKIESIRQRVNEKRLTQNEDIKNTLEAKSETEEHPNQNSIIPLNTGHVEEQPIQGNQVNETNDKKPPLTEAWKKAESKVHHILNYIKDNPDSYDFEKIYKINEEEAQNIYAQSGVQVNKGASIQINSDTINKYIRQNNGSEEDVTLIPHILSSPDFIYQNNNNIAFEQTSDNGSSIVAEFKKDNKGNLILNAIYKKENQNAISEITNNNSESDVDKKQKETSIERMLLTDIHTDEKRFQARKKLNETIVNKIADNFSDADQDPVHIWKDPKDGKYYVLSGHHRYYGAKKADIKQVKVIDRSNDFTEAQAIKFAKEEANVNRSMETPLERANTLRQKRENGDSKNEIDKFLNNEGRNKNLVNNLSHLNPNGKAAQSIHNFEGTIESDSKRETEKIADWIGEARRLLNNIITDAHEDEMFDFLNNKNQSKRFTNKREFVEKVRSLVGTLDFDSNKPLNLARVSVKGNQEQEWENRAKELEAEIKNYDRQIEELDQRFTDPKRVDYINRSIPNFQTLKDRAREQKKELKRKQEIVYKNLDEHKKAKGQYLKADASQGNLFEDMDFKIQKSRLDSEKNGYQKGISREVFEKLIEKLKKPFTKAFKNLHVTTNWNEFVQKANEYHNKKQGIERQIIGEKGAEQLDDAEEVTHRMDNLSVAREMETAGKSPKEIRLATGWERGADNKWRYEIPDLNIKRENVYDETGKLIAIPTAKQWFEYHNRNNESLQPLYLKDFKPTEKEIDEAEFLGDELSKIIDIYPELGEIRIIVHPKEKSIAQAFYSPKLRLISFREDSRSFDEDFIHEIQHAIQKIEGFAYGGNSIMFKDITNRDVAKKLSDKANEIFENHSEEWKKKVRAINEAKIRKDFDKSEALEEEFYNTESEESIRAYDEYSDLRFEAQMYMEDPDRVVQSSHDQYKALQGEVEARNVQSRMNMTAQERRKKLLSETEDVAREDQILSANSIGESANYVSGNNNDISYMKTPSGVVYGAKLSDGTIYINPKHLNANTPIHEFGHLWEQLMPKRFAKGVELLKNTKAGKDLFQKLKTNKGYSNYSDEKLWSETLVTMIGNRGEELFHSSSKSKFVEWVKDFFKTLGEILYKLSNGLIGKELTPNDKLSTFIKGALNDIMGSKEILPESEITDKESSLYIKNFDDKQMLKLLHRIGVVIPAKCR